MTQKSGISQILLVVVLAILLVGVVVYMYVSQKAQVKENSTVLIPESELPENTNTDETPANVDKEVPNREDTPMIDFTTWAIVEGDGYEFRHPDYFIRDNGDHYIIAYEPRVGQEFSAMAIFKPVEISDPMATLEKKIGDSEGLGVNVVSQPGQVTLDGFKSAYAVEYEIQSGPTTGLNKYYLLQSPYTDKWAAIEFADNDTAENIMNSFLFVEE